MTDLSSLAQEVAELIGTVLKKTIDPSRLDALLVDDYGADSMDMVDIVEAMERKYGIVVSDDQIRKLESVGDVVRKLDELLGAS